MNFISAMQIHFARRQASDDIYVDPEVFGTFKILVSNSFWKRLFGRNNEQECGVSK